MRGQREERHLPGSQNQDPMHVIGITTNSPSSPDGKRKGNSRHADQTTLPTRLHLIRPSRTWPNNNIFPCVQIVKK